MLLKPELEEPMKSAHLFVRTDRFVAKAGTFVNGPDLDKGPSDLSVDHTFQLNGLVELPWQFQIQRDLSGAEWFSL